MSANKLLDVSEQPMQIEDHVLYLAASLNVTPTEAKHFCNGDIKIKYHPYSNKPYKIILWEDYYLKQSRLVTSAENIDPELWHGR